MSRRDADVGVDLAPAALSLAPTPAVTLPLSRSLWNKLGTLWMSFCHLWCRQRCPWRQSLAPLERRRWVRGRPLFWNPACSLPGPPCSSSGTS